MAHPFAYGKAGLEKTFQFAHDTELCYEDIRVKSIDKGVNKNLVARLVSLFANHVELFNSMGCGTVEDGKR